MSFESDFYQGIIENLHAGLYFVDPKRTITYWNKAAEEISGFKAKEVIGKSCADQILTHVDSDGNRLCDCACPLAATMSDGRPREAQVFMHHKNGQRIPVWVRASSLTDEDGRVVGGIELFTDMSNHAANELRVQELEKLALLDRLTNLANRHYVEREIEVGFEEMKRLEIPFGVLFMDIDYFKKLNDTYGHDVGDEVLKFVAETLVMNSRPFDLYGRWGGEEFIAVIRNTNEDELVTIGERTRKVIQNAFIEHDHKELGVTVSIGATLATHADDLDTLIKRADRLLYMSKDAGRNRLTLG